MAPHTPITSPVDANRHPPHEATLKDGRRAVLRVFQKADVDAIWVNFNEVVAEGVYLPVYTPVVNEWEKLSWFHDIVEDGNICVVAEVPPTKRRKAGPGVVGQVTIEHIPWEAAGHVGQLGIIVKKGYRNLGIGYQLINFAALIARARGKRKLILSTLASNQMGVHLYQKAGFRTVGTYTGQYYLAGRYQDEILMEWVFPGK